MSKAPVYYRKGDAPPSPYRIGWTPTCGEEWDRHTRWIDCPRGTRVEAAALRFARPYASNCGLSGRIEVQWRASTSDAWKTIRTATVKNSEAGPWVVPC